MIKFKGKGVYGAVAIGRISVFNRQEAQVRRIHITDAEFEKNRIKEAEAVAIRQLKLRFLRFI